MGLYENLAFITDASKFRCRVARTFPLMGVCETCKRFTKLYKYAFPLFVEVHRVCFPLNQHLLSHIPLPGQSQIETLFLPCCFPVISQQSILKTSRLSKITQIELWFETCSCACITLREFGFSYTKRERNHCEQPSAFPSSMRELITHHVMHLMSISFVN